MCVCVCARVYVYISFTFVLKALNFSTITLQDSLGKCNSSTVISLPSKHKISLKLCPSILANVS